MMNVLNVSMNQTIREIQDAIFNQLNLTRDDIKEFDLDIEFIDGLELDVNVHY